MNPAATISASAFGLDSRLPLLQRNQVVVVLRSGIVLLHMGHVISPCAAQLGVGLLPRGSIAQPIDHQVIGARPSPSRLGWSGVYRSAFSGVSAPSGSTPITVYGSPFRWIVLPPVPDRRRTYSATAHSSGSRPSARAAGPPLRQSCAPIADAPPAHPDNARRCARVHIAHLLAGLQVHARRPAARNR